MAERRKLDEAGCPGRASAVLQRKHSTGPHTLLRHPARRQRQLFANEKCVRVSRWSQHRRLNRAQPFVPQPHPSSPSDGLLHCPKHSLLSFACVMKAYDSLSYLATAAIALSGAAAQSWDTIPEIEVYGQHFFYTNNGSQL